MLGIDTKDAEGVAIVVLKGRLVLGDECLSLTRHIQHLVQEQRSRFVINIEQLTFIDSCGVGELIAVFTAVKKRGGNLKLAGPRDQVLKVLQVVCLPQVIEVYESEERALASFDAM